jgi:hypothetical protein
MLKIMERWFSVSSDSFTLVLLGTLAVMLLWEAVAPYRELTPERSARWRMNIMLYVIGAAMLALLAPLSLVAVARWAAAAGWGLLNQLALPAWLVNRAVGARDGPRQVLGASCDARSPVVVAHSSHASQRQRNGRHHEPAIPPA